MNNRGAVLITILIVMLLGASLGAGIYTLTSSNIFNELTANSLNKAQFLAESGVRYAMSQRIAATPSAGNTYTLVTADRRMNIRVRTDGTIVSTGIANQGGHQEARKTISYNPAGGTGRRPPRGNPTAVTTTFTDLTALDTSGAGNRVSIRGYVATGGTHLYWAAFSNLATSQNRTEDPEAPGCWIGGLVVPIAQDRAQVLRDVWNQYGQVSYSIQIKMGWYIGMTAAVSGLNFRWHESPDYPGKYQGYGLSFIVFNSTSCGAENWDYIPNSLKTQEQAGKLFLILWEQRVVSNVETKRVLAYALLGTPGNTNPNDNTTLMNDPKVVGNQGYPDGILNDNASLLVRVEDVVLLSGRRVNEIKLYYGDASNYANRTAGTRAMDDICTNIDRGRYSPQWIDNALFPKWPSNIYETYTDYTTLTYWSYPPWQPSTNFVAGDIVIPWFRNNHNYLCTTAGSSGADEPSWPLAGSVSDGSAVWRENGTDRPTRYDYFTLATTNPVLPHNTVTLYKNNAATDIQILADGATIQTPDFALDTFPNSRRELGLHAFGNFNPSVNNWVIAFDDMAVQILGATE